MYQTPSEKVRDLTNQLNQWRHEYYNLNAPSVSDSTYDHFCDELELLERESGCRMSNSPTQTVGYSVVSGLEKTVHSVPLLEDIHCHHIIPREKQGTDKYENLTLVLTPIHRLIHAKDEGVIRKYLEILNLNQQQKSKLNELRWKSGVNEID